MFLKDKVIFMNDTQIPYPELLITVLLEVREKYPNYKYKHKGMTFSISRKGWFGEKLYNGIVEEDGKITLDVLKQEYYVGELAEELKKKIVNPKKILVSNNEIIQLGTYLEEQFIKVFQKKVFVNIVEKIV